MDFAELDKSQFPIVTYKIKPIEPTLKQYEEYLNHQVEFMRSLAPNERMILILDYTHLKFLTSDMRIKRGQFVKDNDEIMRRTIYHIVIMAPSIMARMMIQGVFLVKKPSSPTDVVGSMAEALAIAAAQCKKMQAGK